MLVVEDLTKIYQNGLFKTNTVKAVNKVSFSIKTSEAFGLVGKSGSGKTTIARLLMRAITPSSGRILYYGTDLTTLSAKKFRPYARKLQIISQQPTLALDPRKTIGESIIEPLYVHGLIKSKSQVRIKLDELLTLTNLSAEILQRYPSQISGGQAQRVVIARALGLEPELIIADEPTSMLDISVQAQILNLLKMLQKQKGISILLISHDIAVIRAFCDKVALLEEGRIIATGKPADILLQK